MEQPITRKSEPAHAGASLAFLALAAALLGTGMLVAQNPDVPAPAPVPTASSTRKARPRTRPNVTQPQTPQVEAAPVPAPAPPPASEMPHWPANDQPAQAEVTWDSHGLSIDAANSSLVQILKDVSTATGTKVEGLGSDQRIFGVYGPGQARDVLSQLLQGSGYNVIMIGDQGQGAPRQILLSLRQSADAQMAANKKGPNDGDEDAADNDAEEQPAPAPVPMPMRPGFGPGGRQRTPQEVMQEMQRRQQQMRENNPQN